MPARTDISKFTASFWRDNECIDAHVARDGTRAAQMATVLIGQFTPLQGGKVIVTKDSGELPEPSRSAHDLPPRETLASKFLGARTSKIQQDISFEQDVQPSIDGGISVRQLLQRIVGIIHYASLGCRTALTIRPSQVAQVF